MSSPTCLGTEVQSNMFRHLECHHQAKLLVETCCIKYIYIYIYIYRERERERERVALTIYLRNSKC